MKSLIIVFASLGAVVATFPLQEKLKFKSSPLPLMDIDDVDVIDDNKDRKLEPRTSSPFVKALPFTRQRAEAPDAPVVKEAEVAVVSASPHNFILRGITGVGDKKRAVILIKGSADAKAYSYNYEDKISDSGYVVYAINNDHVVLDHSIYEDIILSFDYDNDFSATMQKKAGELEQKTQKEITKIYQKKAGSNSKQKTSQESKMWEERKKRYEQFRKMREVQEKNKASEGHDKKKKSTNRIANIKEENQ